MIPLSEAELQAILDALLFYQHRSSVADRDPALYGRLNALQVKIDVARRRQRSREHQNRHSPA